MKLKNLMIYIPYTVIRGNNDIEIENISWDTRRMKPNSLFICTRGRNVDRHDFALDAVSKGAIALVVEHDVENIPENVTIIKVDNSRSAMAQIANIFYGEPSKKFNLVGITGTKGKTSITYYVAQVLENLGHKVGVIGTIENRVGDIPLKTEKLNPTTPDAIELQETFVEILGHGACDVVMEVTSSALDNHRVDSCDFNIGVFTNLSQDHLDEHGTMENYKRAKMKLFRMCKKGVINADDPVSEEIKEYASCSIMTFGIEKDADIMAKNIEFSLEGVTFILDFFGEKRKVHINIPGKFSVYNTLASIGICYSLGVSMNSILEGIEKVHGVRGRFERVPNNKGILAIVDYAHSPDSLKSILESVKEFSTRRLITVFGCGGNRDRLKRPIMGEIAGNLSDYCIITSDNPRKENPLEIIDEIEVGIRKTPCPYKKIESRREAIHAALDSSEPGDIVVIAGKGHETYQIIGDETIHFDDVEVVKEYLG